MFPLPQVKLYDCMVMPSVKTSTPNWLNDSIDEILGKRQYQFCNGQSVEGIVKAVELDMLEMLGKHFPDGHTTKSINKTGMPDEAIMELIHEEGQSINSIYELEYAYKKLHVDDNRNLALTLDWAKRSDNGD